MSEPSTTRVPSIRDCFDAVNRVEQRLLEVTRALDDAGIPYAVIGGKAVASWVEAAMAGAARATKDVDIRLHRADLQATAAVARCAGVGSHAEARILID
jgi:hypothetical protein